MRTLLKRIFLKNWPRKCLSLILGIIIWFVVNQSLTSTRTVSNVPVRVDNLPPGKTVKGLQSNGRLDKRIALTLSGSKDLLERLNPSDLEVVFDASGKHGEWIASISKGNLRSNNLQVNLHKGIRKVAEQSLVLKMVNLVTEKIPILITKPMGEASRGYQYIDVWPYRLHITVTGPDTVIKQLKTKGIKLTFNLNDITRRQLDELRSKSTDSRKDVISFYVPSDWKQVSIPVLSGTPIEINDPESKGLQIDFLRNECLELSSPLPVSLYFPPSKSHKLNPQKISLSPTNLIELKNGLKVINRPLYVKGVSSLFLEMVKDRMEIAIIVPSKKEDTKLKWSVQFQGYRSLEDQYVRAILSDISEDNLSDAGPNVREETIRNRFRSYMNRFTLYLSVNEELELVAGIKGNTVSVRLHSE